MVEGNIPSSIQCDESNSGAGATTGSSVADASRPFTICSVNDYQIAAKGKLSRALYEYLASGTDDEQTLHENRAGFKGWFLRPRILRPVGNLSTATRVTFGRMGKTTMEFRMPLFVSPAGVHALCDSVHGECATAAACGKMGIPFGLSQHATRSIEQVAAAAPNTQKWFQSYILKDRKLTLRLIERAARAGYVGIFLTVDSVRFGYREADARNGFDSLPPPHRLVNYDEPTDDGSQSPAKEQFLPGRSLESTYNARKHKAWDQNSEMMFEQDVSWDDVRLLKEHSACKHLPLVIKGIMTAEDAVLAVEAGADGIMVSNHGGRQQDGCLGTIDALPEVVQAVRGSGVPVFLDGGVRRGTDILKALALGASAVGIGKPVFFALAVGGQAAVENMLKMFQRELEAAMALTGCCSVSDITEALVTRHPQNQTRPGSCFVRARL